MTTALRPAPRAVALGVLIACGVAWGSTQSLGKVATATGHAPLGLLFWQLAYGALIMGALLVVRRTRPVATAPAIRWAAVVALLGTILPGITFWLSVARLPAGVMSIVISAVPLLALPIAAATGHDRITAPRTLGLLLGLGGVLVLAATGSAGHGEGATTSTSPLWLLVALLGPLFYAVEANVVADNGTAGMDPIQAMFLVSCLGAAAMLPAALLSGQWIDLAAPWGPAEWAILAGSAVHAVAYAAYVWLAARAGAVFAAQSSYLVTASGLLWASALLGERLSPLVILALALMLGGVFLVSPRNPADLEAGAAPRV